MSADRNTENLISGYLDNQLTPDERQQVNELLRSDSKFQALYESLKSQSTEMASLPKFRLGKNFSKQFFNNQRVEAAFSKAGGKEKLDDSANDGKSTLATDVQSTNYKYAIAAIASLAAMVLVTLFVPIANDVIPSVAQFKPGEESAAKATDDFSADETNESKATVENQAGVNEIGKGRGGKGGGKQEPDKGSVDSLKESSERFAGDNFDKNAARKSAPMAEKLAEDSKSLKRSSDFSNDDGITVAETAKGSSAIEHRQLAADRFKPGSAQTQSTQSADPNRGMGFANEAPDFEDSKQGIVKDENIADQKVPSQSNRVFQSLDDDTMNDREVPELADVQEQTDSWGSGDITDLVRKRVAAQSELEDKLSSNGLADAVLELSTVLEIDYNGGPEMFAEFQKSMARNSITLELNENENPESQTLVDEPANLGGGLVAGGAGRDLQDQRKNQQAQAGVAFGLTPPEQAAQAFLVTATPDQMIRLVEEVKTNASISSIQLAPSAGYLDFARRQQIEAAKQFQLEQLGRLKDGITRSTSQQAASKSDADKSQYKQVPAYSNFQSQATQLQRNFRIEQDVEELRNELGVQLGNSINSATRSNRQNGLKTSPSQSTQSAVQQQTQQNSGFDSISPNRVRNYLLFVRTKESAASAESEADESTQPPDDKE